MPHAFYHLFLIKRPKTVSLYIITQHVPAMEINNFENLFEAKLAKNEMIEPKDWMPENYRKHLIRQISQHADRKSVV